jgi:YVTN family beta-propeller protein
MKSVTICPIALCGLLGALVGIATRAPASQPDASSHPILRRPIAVVPIGRSSLALVANQRSGTISTIDFSAGKVVRESPVGKRLSDLTALGDGKHFLATDDSAHELILLTLADDAVTVRQRLPVSPYPAAIAASADGKRAWITSLWSRRLTSVRIDAGESQPLAVQRQVDVSFPPRALALVEGGQRLIVGDAFAGRLGIFALPDLALETERTFPGHNIRGMLATPDGQKLVVAHQMLNDLAHTIRNDVHWGMLMSNDLRWLKVESVLTGGRELYFGSHMHPLGEAGRGAADPAGAALAPDGTVVVALAGVNEVAVGRESDFSLYRLAVGKRPVDVAITPDGKSALVANQFGDSISVVNLAAREVTATIPLGPMPELSLVEKGELLFHDGSLAHDAWMTCASCHAEGHTTGQLNDNFSDLSFGAPKRVLSLLSQADTAPYAWLGTNPDLQTQIKSSIEKTMQFNDEAPPDALESLAAYVATLKLPPPLDDLRGTRDEAAIARGKLVFERRQCADCHAPPAYTTPEAYDVGLKDKQGNTRFNPPSLRGISHRDSFFHDNSAQSLSEVFLQHSHPDGSRYKESEVRDLLHFLRSL